MEDYQKDVQIEKIFGERLTRLYSESGCRTVYSLAKELELPRSSVGYYLAGQRTPECSQLVKIARYFHTSADYLLGLSDTR